MINWDEYLIAKKTGVRRVWKPLLEKNIAQFETLAGESLKLEIHELCVKYFDHGFNSIPIQHPKIFDKILSQWNDEIALNNEKYLLWAYKANGFNGVHNIFQREEIANPALLLEKVLTLNPDNLESKQLLLLHHLEHLDFALHELPFGLVLNKSACLNSIKQCENIIIKNPDLAAIKTRFGGDFQYYKTMYFSWIEYENKKIKEDFFEWLKASKRKQAYE